MFVFGSVHAQLVDLDEFAAELAAVDALGYEYRTVPVIRDRATHEVITVSAGDGKGIFYDTIDSEGQTQRVFARVGIPANASPTNKVPAIVFVHGGGGYAFDAWLTQWVEQGYAAILIAVEGHIDQKLVKQPWAGPSRIGIYGDSWKALEDQWMYHAVVDTILANSLMRSLSMVDDQHVAIMGVSWGGVITSTVVGIDDRFTFAISAYGCGAQTQWRGTWSEQSRWGTALRNNTLYQKVWDSLLRMDRVTIPMLWLSSPRDENFPISREAVTYRAAPRPRIVAQSRSGVEAAGFLLVCKQCGP